MTTWIKKGSPSAPLAYRGQQESVLWVSKDKTKAVEVANILGLGDYNVIFMGQNGRKVLKECGNNRDAAIKFAKQWMRQH